MSILHSAKFFNKVLKKDDKGNDIIKYSNYLKYDSINDFNKYNVSKFNEILIFLIKLRKT